jgi:hypothetical protein
MSAASLSAPLCRGAGPQGAERRDRGHARAARLPLGRGAARGARSAASPPHSGGVDATLFAAGICAGICAGTCAGLGWLAIGLRMAMAARLGEGLGEGL